MSRPTDYESVGSSYESRYGDGRYRETARFLEDLAARAPGPRTLEVGCGTGHWLEIFARARRSAVGLDASAHMLAGARSRRPEARVVQGTARALPFREDSFDLVTCVNAFHHFDDRAAVVREARRVLGGGGRFVTIGLDPHAGSDRWFVYDYFRETLDIDRARFPSTGEIRALLADAGFGEIRVEVAERLVVDEPARPAIDDGRLDRSVTSQLGVLTDEEYRRGLDAIEAAIERDDDLHLTGELRLWATSAVAP